MSTVGWINRFEFAKSHITCSPATKQEMSNDPVWMFRPSSRFFMHYSSLPQDPRRRRSADGCSFAVSFLWMWKLFLKGGGGAELGVNQWNCSRISVGVIWLAFAARFQPQRPGSLYLQLFINAVIAVYARLGIWVAGSQGGKIWTSSEETDQNDSQCWISGPFLRSVLQEKKFLKIF